jgi:histone acetyltransferase (RNA polymerase elongator complex component)
VSSVIDNFKVNVCREYGQSTTLSQESILQALQVEDKTLSQQIRRKSLEFAEIVKQ